MISHKKRRLLRWTIAHRSFVVVALLATSILQPSFDSSAVLLLQLDTSSSPFLTALATPLARWDTLHFLGMASPRPLPLPLSTSNLGQEPTLARGGGLRYEHSFAFQPGIIFLLQFLGRCTSDQVMSWCPAQAVLLTSALATLLSLPQPMLLYHLSKKLTGNRKFALLSAYLSILSPSPATLVTPTTESFFSFFALLGHISISTRSHDWRIRLPLAAVFYALATAFRSNGIFLAGFLLWESLRQGWSLQNVVMTPVLIVVSIMPFLFSQVLAHARLCPLKSTSQPWCSNVIPSVYSFVQRQYWDVGLLRYWTASQLPNWILSGPLLCTIALWTLQHYQKDPIGALRRTFWSRKMAASEDPLLPHAHYTLFTSLLLLFHSHIQIILRFATAGSLPAVWWGISQILHSSRNDESSTLRWRQGRGLTLVAYLVVWNMMSIVLYAGFYPPA